MEKSGNGLAIIHRYSLIFTTLARIAARIAARIVAGQLGWQLGSRSLL